MTCLRFSLLFGAISAAAQLGWPTGSVHHAFHDTPKGQLHYVTSALKTSLQPPLLYLHSHPRSSADFRYVFAELGYVWEPRGGVPLIAVDWFGMGSSEDYKGKNATDEFCTFEEFASYVLEIVTKEGVKEFVPVGALKGAMETVEVAALAGPDRVKKVAFLGILILSPQQQNFIKNMLVPMSRHPHVFANGSHMLNIWNDPSGTDPIYPGEELVNQEKTNDASRSMFTNWGLQAAWAAYNEKLPKRLAEVDAFADTMFLHPLIAYKKWSSFGLSPTFSLSKLDEVLTHGRNTSYFVEAGEGCLHQNATYLAKIIAEFLAKPVVSGVVKAIV